MAVERCAYSDLPTDQCAHCRGVDDRDVQPTGGLLSDLHDSHEPVTFQAQYMGMCVACHERIEIGDWIEPVSLPKFGYMHEECP